MVSEKAIQLVIHQIEKSGYSYEKIASDCNLSKATISRLVTKHQCSLYTFNILTAYYEIGETVAALNEEEGEPQCTVAADLRNEIKQIEEVYAEREARLLRQAEERVAAIQIQYNMMREQFELIKNQFDDAIANRDGHFTRSVDYLKHLVVKREGEVEEWRQRALTAEANEKATKESHDLHCRTIHRRYRFLSWGWIILFGAALLLGWFTPPPV